MNRIVQLAVLVLSLIVSCGLGDAGEVTLVDGIGQTSTHLIYEDTASNGISVNISTAVGPEFAITKVPFLISHIGAYLKNRQDSECKSDYPFIAELHYWRGGDTLELRSVSSITSGPVNRYSYQTALPQFMWLLREMGRYQILIRNLGPKDCGSVLVGANIPRPFQALSIGPFLFLNLSTDEMQRSPGQFAAIRVKGFLFGHER